MSNSSVPLIEQELEAFLVAIQQNLVNTYFNISAICFLVYDILVNLDREVECIWKSRWSISKALFIFGRYYGLLFNIVNFAATTKVGLSLQFCRGWIQFNILGGSILFTTVVNVILSMRLHALYASRKIVVFLVSMLICEFAAELYVCTTMAIKTAKSVVSVPADIPLPGCIAYPNTRETLIAWVPCILVATTFFIMTIVKVFGDGYSTQKRLMDIKHISPLIISYVRDGFVYYFLMFAILIISVVLNQTQVSMPVSNLPLPWLIAIYSLSASRLVLNLREAAGRTHYGVSSGAGSQTTTAPVFAMNPIRESQVTESFA